MKRFRLLLSLALLAVLGGCGALNADLKSPCACEDGERPRINQKA